MTNEDELKQTRWSIGLARAPGKGKEPFGASGPDETKNMRLHVFRVSRATRELTMENGQVVALGKIMLMIVMIHNKQAKGNETVYAAVNYLQSFSLLEHERCVGM